MQEQTAQDRIQSLIAQHEVGPKKAAGSDIHTIAMLKPLVKKQYPTDPVKYLEAVITDLNAILKIKYTQTTSRKGLRKITTLTPDVLGGNITPGIHGDVENLVTELKQKLADITAQATTAAKNNATELAEAKRKLEEALAEKAKADAAAAQERAKTEALAVEKAKTDAALAAEKEKGKKERERLRAERKEAQKEARAKEKAAQEAQAQLQTKDAEVREAKIAAVKTQAEFQEYREGEEQRLQQATLDGARQMASVMSQRMLQFIDTNEIMRIAMEKSFGTKEQFASAFITGNMDPTSKNGSGQLSQRAPTQVTAPVSELTVDPRLVRAQAEEEKYKKFLGAARFKIILDLILLHDKATTDKEKAMVKYLICQLVLHVNDKSIKNIANEASELFIRRGQFLSHTYPTLHGFLKDLSEEPQNENELTNALLTKDLCSFMVKRLGGKPESGVLLLPEDQDAKTLFSKYYKEVSANKTIIAPSFENEYRELALGVLGVTKATSPTFGKKSTNTPSNPNHLVEVSQNTLSH